MDQKTIKQAFEYRKDSDLGEAAIVAEKARNSIHGVFARWER